MLREGKVQPGHDLYMDKMLNSVVEYNLEAMKFKVIPIESNTDQICTPMSQ